MVAGFYQNRKTSFALPMYEKLQNTFELLGKQSQRDLQNTTFSHKGLQLCFLLLVLKDHSISYFISIHVTQIKAPISHSYNRNNLLSRMHLPFQPRRQKSLQQKGLDPPNIHFSCKSKTQMAIYKTAKINHSNHQHSFSTWQSYPVRLFHVNSITGMNLSIHHQPLPKFNFLF